METPTYDQYWQAEQNYISRTHVNMRIKNGWSIERAITVPVNTHESDGEIPIEDIYYVRGAQ